MNPARFGWRAWAAILAVVGLIAFPIARRARTALSGGAGRTAVLAILPVDNPTGDSQAGHLGFVLASAAAAHLSSIPGVTVVSRTATARYEQTRRDLAPLQQEHNVAYVLDLTVKSGGERAELLARMRGAGDGATVWEQTLAGTPIDVERALLVGLGRALERPILNRRLSDAERARLTTPSSSGDALLAYIQARALLDRSDLAANVQSAIALLEGAAERNGSDALIQATLAVALLTRFERQHEPALLDRARSAVRTALTTQPDLSAAHYASAYLQYVTGARDAAIDSCRRAIELDRDNDDAHRLLGLALARAGRMDEAITELTTSVALNPVSFDSHFRLGTALYLSGRYAEAVSEYQRAAAIEPERADVYTNLGTARAMLGQVDDAIGNYEHAIRLGGTDALAYGNLGMVYYLARRYDDSLAAYRRAVERDPNRASLHRDLGDVLLKRGNRSEATAEYNTAIALAARTLKMNPRDASSVVLVAVCEARLGQHKEAERHAAEAVTLAPNDRDVLFRAAKAYAIAGSRASALDRVQAAIAAGYNPALARKDPDLSSITPSAEFERAIEAGLRSRSTGTTQ